MVTPIIQNYRIRASLGVIGAGKILARPAGTH